jgi:hypothetical protein
VASNESVGPQSRFEALTLALELAITASTEEHSQQALSMAEQLAAGMTEIEVKRAQKLAQEQAQQWWTGES